MLHVRVLLANEPRAYREVIAAALRSVRPGLEVLAVAPEDLESSLASFSPQLVVCSATCATDRDFTCVSLYPGGASTSVISRRGDRRNVPDIQFDTLIALIDELGLPPAAAA